MKKLYTLVMGISLLSSLSLRAELGVKDLGVVGGAALAAKFFAELAAIEFSDSTSSSGIQAHAGSLGVSSAIDAGFIFYFLKYLYGEANLDRNNFMKSLKNKNLNTLDLMQSIVAAFGGISRLKTFYLTYKKFSHANTIAINNLTTTAKPILENEKKLQRWWLIGNYALPFLSFFIEKAIASTIVSTDTFTAGSSSPDFKITSMVSLAAVLSEIVRLRNLTHHIKPSPTPNPNPETKNIDIPLDKEDNLLIIKSPRNIVAET